MRAVATVVGRMRVSVVVGLLAASASGAREARADELACITASENEVALRKQLHLREALQQLVVCSAPECPAVVKAECDRRLHELNDAVPTVVLAATDATGNDLANVAVTLDGVAFASVLDGRALPLDPGAHTLHFAGPGGASLDKSIVAREGEKGRRVTVVLGAPAPAVPVAVPVVTGTAPTVPVAEPTPKGASLGAQRTLAVVAASVGVLGVGVGSVFGAVALSDASTQRSDCPTSQTTCAKAAAAQSAHDSSVTAGNFSTAMFVVGGAGLATGAILWLTAPKRASAEPKEAAVGLLDVRLDPVVGPQGAGAFVSGRFE
jgi:hypothetical protein